jgi:hypothetical protein
MQGLEPMSDAEKSIINLPSGAAMREQLYMTPSVEPTRKDSGQATPLVNLIGTQRVWLMTIPYNILRMKEPIINQL